MVSYAPENADKVPINDWRQPTSVVVITVDSSVLPMQAEVRTFSQLTDEGIPVSDVPTKASECDIGPRRESLCWITAAKDAAHVHIEPEAVTTGVTVVELYYATQTAADTAEGVNHYAVSWAFRTG